MDLGLIRLAVTYLGYSMTIAVQRLDEGARAALTAHFVALRTEDRRLRFGASLSSEAIAAYVDRIDFDRDAVFGVYDDDLALVGVAHVALGEELAELGLSVLHALRLQDTRPRTGQLVRLHGSVLQPAATALID